MKAIILAAGRGKRFGDMTKKIPKCLIEINGMTILERMLLSLIHCKVKEIIITTGYLDHMIRSFIDKKINISNKLSIVYVQNTKYAETDYIYSFWLAKNAVLHQNILLLHGDLIYDTSLIKRLVQQDRSVVTVNKHVETPQKDFKARIKNGRVAEIGVNVFGKDAFLSMPMYRLVKKDTDIWMKEIDKYVKNKQTMCYAENAFNDVADKINLYPLYFNKEFCREIDTEEDLLQIKRLLV